MIIYYVEVYGNLGFGQMRFRQKSFGKNMKPTNEQCLEICKFCIAYLYDKYSTDKGLFRSTVSQTDVRSLQSQVAQSPQNKFREDLDPNVVAEVLQTTFKDMSSPLLNDVYHDIVETGSLSHVDCLINKFQKLVKAIWSKSRITSKSG